MTQRRRRRERRGGPHARALSASTPRRGEQQRRELALRLERLGRWRTVLGALGFIPLIGSLGCTTGIAGAFCVVPREVYLGLWAALFGSFIGLTFRMWRERRRAAAAK